MGPAPSAAADEALRVAMAAAQYEDLIGAIEDHHALASEGVLAEARAMRERLHQKRRQQSQKLRRKHAARRWRCKAARRSCHCTRSHSRRLYAACRRLSIRRSCASIGPGGALDASCGRRPHSRRAYGGDGRLWRAEAHRQRRLRPRLHRGRAAVAAVAAARGAAAVAAPQARRRQARHVGRARSRRPAARRECAAAVQPPTLAAAARL